MARTKVYSPGPKMSVNKEMIRPKVTPKKEVLKGDTSKIKLGFKAPSYADTITADRRAAAADLQAPRRSAFDAAGELVPYLSNAVNMFRRPPSLGAPRTISPVTAGRINLSNQRVEAERMVRGADLAASRTLDENSAASVRSANLVGGIREVNTINQAEENANVENRRWAAQMNAGIDAQNTQTFNRRQEDNVAASIAHQREQSANIANAADKFMLRKGEKDKAQLDKDKLRVLSRMWKDSGVYDRTKEWMKKEGINTPMAMGGKLDPVKPQPGNENYYKASAQLAHYKGVLNNKLKEKNPEGFNSYFKGLRDYRMKADSLGAEKYIQEAKYNDFLSAQEVKSTLGEQDYGNYLKSLQEVNDYNVGQGKRPLYGEVEGEQDINNLAYGRRFASLQMTPKFEASNPGTHQKYTREYVYNAKKKMVDVKESGDQTLKPLNFKRYGGRLKAY